MQQQRTWNALPVVPDMNVSISHGGGSFWTLLLLSGRF